MHPRPFSPGVSLLVATLLIAAGPSPSGAADLEPAGNDTSAGSETAAAPAQGNSAPALGDASRPAMGEEIVVTATRSPRPVRDVPAAVTVIPRAEIERSPSKTADELLRIVPSFGVFRRSNSIAADPSSQGVNLRGIGPSGVSRSLVLRDGLQMNDPFGGWVYWRTVPTLGVERIEVVPGGGSALYGNYALGGVTQVVSRAIAPRSFEMSAEGGSFDTARFGAWASHRAGPLGAALETDLLTSSSYPVVADYARGPVDSHTPSKHAVVNGRVEAAARSDLLVGLRGGFFYQNQNGGTRFTTAMVRQWEYAATARYAPGGFGAVDLTLFGHRGTFKQDRARVTNGRANESLAARQDVPSHDLGAGLLWTSLPVPLGGAHVLSLGANLQRITGETSEGLFPAPPVAPAAVVERHASGEQVLYGVFAQDVYDVVEALSITGAVRYDRWTNFNASRLDGFADGTQQNTGFPRRTEDQVSPKLGVRVRPLGPVTLRAAAYTSFRAPTLNELYRPFQVGTVRTDSNPDLRAEELRGAEAGVELALARGARVRATGFWNQLDNPIINVTTPATAPNRQRQNLGSARIRGVEAEAGWRFARHWLATAAYTLVDSRVVDAPGQPQLVGKQLPQDPRHRASASLAYDAPRLLTGDVHVRYVGSQFEDDLNTLKMGEALIVDLFAAWHLTRHVDLFAAVDNLFDKTYLVGRAGVDTVGEPRFIHGGFRLHQD